MLHFICTFFTGCERKTNFLKKGAWIFLLGGYGLLVSNGVCGQALFGEQQVISTDADGANDVFAADLDGDGDTDVLSASFNDGKVTWYENDGSGNFEEQSPISLNTSFPKVIHGADLNNDGDIDILSAHQSLIGLDEVVWYENNGDGTFENMYVVDQQISVPLTLLSADMDADSDIDIVTIDTYNERGQWFENVGDGNFDENPSNSFDVGLFIERFELADLNQDGDIDVIGSSTAYDRLWGFLNNGNGYFSTAFVIGPSNNSSVSIKAADIDNNNTVDVVSAAKNENKIVWYANDGTAYFNGQQIISLECLSPRAVYCADVDNDEDLDVVSACYDDSKIAWYENLGEGNFSSLKLVSSMADGALDVHVADLNGDGNMDIISASENDNKIAWYENLSPPLSVAPHHIQIKQAFTTYPNPVPDHPTNDTTPNH